MLRLSAPWAHLSITLYCDCHTLGHHGKRRKATCCQDGRKEGRAGRLGSQRGLQTHHLFQNPIGRASDVSYSQYCSSSLVLCSFLPKWTDQCKESLCSFYLLDCGFFQGPPLLSLLCSENSTINLKRQAGLNRRKSKQEAQVAHWADVLQSYQRLPLHNGDRLAYRLVI